MGTIHTENRKGVEIRYVDAQNGIKLFLLPNVPEDAGEIYSEKNFDLEGAVSKFPEGERNIVRRIGEKYVGRQLDATSILLYAEEQGKFEEYIKKLDTKPKDFEFIHPDLMMARTDVSAFFLRHYANLGIAPNEVAEEAERQLRNYGVGIVVHPKKSTSSLN